MATMAQLPPNIESLGGNRFRVKHTGESFSGLHAAKAWLESMGFSVGRQQGPAPIGFLFGDYNVQKWRNLRQRDRDMLDGDIRPDGGLFGDCDAIVWFYDQTGTWWDGCAVVA